MAITYTLTHALAGDAATSIGTIPRNGSLKTNYLPPDLIDAIRAGTIVCSPALTSGVAVATLLDNELNASADAQGDIVDVTVTPTQALVNANFGTLAKELIRVTAIVEGQRATMEAMLARDAATAQRIA